MTEGRADRDPERVDEPVGTDDARPAAAGGEAAEVEAVDAGPLGVRNGLSWAIGGYLGGFLLSLVVAIPYLAITGVDDLGDLSIVDTLVLQMPLWGGLAGAAVLASMRSGSGNLLADYGFTLRIRKREVGIGLLAGLGAQLILVPLLYVILRPLIDSGDLSARARDLGDQSEGLGGAILLILLVMIGAPIVEEIFYRGLVMRSIQRRFGPRWALVGSSLLFGATHLSAIELVFLTAFGFVAGALALRTGRLAAPIVAHVAFNGVTVTALLSGAI